MAKRLSEKDKKEINKLFTNGKNIDEIAKIYECSNLTISRNLKNFFGEDKFKQLKRKNKSLLKDIVLEKKMDTSKNETNSFLENNNKKIDEEFSPLTSFVEITPLDYEIENEPQKDLSSVPLSEVEFPKIVYIIVNSKIELEIKPLKDHPDWQFLAEDELKRNTIEIYEDLPTVFGNKEKACNFALRF